VRKELAAAMAEFAALAVEKPAPTGQRLELQTV
jgi:hypothetical protein